jgi:DNA-binding beta-propeller fold protein YncE
MKTIHSYHRIKLACLFVLCAALAFAAPSQERKRLVDRDTLQAKGLPDNGGLAPGAPGRRAVTCVPGRGSVAAQPILPHPPYEPVDMTARIGTTGLVVYGNTNGLAMIDPVRHVISPMHLNQYDYTIDPETGEPAGGGMLGSEGGGRFDLAMTSDGRTALISNFGDGSVYFVDLSSGTPAVAGMVQLDFCAEDIAIDPTNRWALVTDGSNTKVAVLDIPSRSWVPAGHDGETGEPYSFRVVTDEGDPDDPDDNAFGYANAVAIAADGRTVIVADYFGYLSIFNPRLHVLLLDPATGALTYSESTEPLWKQGADRNSPFPVLYRPVNVAISPDGRTVIAVDAHRSTSNPWELDPNAIFEGCNLAVFTIGSPGHITRRADVIFPYHIDGGQSLVFSADGSRAYLHTIFKEDNPEPTPPELFDKFAEIQVLAIDGPGRVRRIGAMRSPTQRGSSQLFGVDILAITPDGNFLYATNPTMNDGTPVIDVYDLRRQRHVKRIGCPTMYPDPLRDFPDPPDEPVPGVAGDWIDEVIPAGIAFPPGRANRPPVAVIAADKTELFLDVPETALFDGSASYDPEGSPLTYRWTLISMPSGASATLALDGATALLTPDTDVPGTYQVGLAVNDGWVDSTMAVARVTAKFYPVLPPAGATLQRLESDLIFYKEYVNRLAWSANPESHAALAAIRIYRKPKGAADSAYALLASLPPAASGYDDKGLAVDQFFTYRITSFSSRGVESEPAVVGN